MRSFLRKMSARPLRIADRPIRSAATALLLFAALPGFGTGLGSGFGTVFGPGFGFGLGFAAQAAPTPAGTVIRNIAEGSYFNAALGIRETVRSNPVEALVAEVPDMEVTGFTDLVLSRGAMDQYHYEIRNTGNVTLEMTPSMRLQGATGLIGSAELIHDENRNGVIDPQEPVIDAETETAPAAPAAFAARSAAPATFAATPAAAPTSFTMEPGDRLSFIYSFRVSSSAQPGDRFSAILVGNASSISVTSQTELSGEGTGHTTIVVSGLEIEKNQRLQMDDTNGTDTLIYGLRLRNNSEGAVAGYDSVEDAPLRIDGQQVTGVLVRDEIPRNAVFAEILETGGMTGLYHLRDAGAQDYQTTPPADPGMVDAVGFFHAGDYPVGRSTDLSFSVGVEPSLGAVTIDNTAQAYLDVEGDQVGLNSNRVSYALAARQPATLTFIDAVTGADAPYGALDADARLQIVSGACNVSLDVDVVTVTLRSTVTGDIETVAARETGPNTGLFRTAPVPLARMTVPVHGDGVMASDQGDRIQALSRCGNTLLEDMLLVEPGNFLFNSVTNDPVEGITLVLVEMGSGREMARTVTDARGFYAFGSVEAGDYRISTLDAPEWVFPSVRLDFPGYGRQVLPAAFGASFAHEGGVVAITDIPVDPYYGAPLALRKSAERDSIGQGEFLLYTLEIDNNMHQALIDAQIFDRPPFGTELVAGSVTLDGAVLADPVRDAEGDMIFELGNLLPLERYELSYLLHFTAAAREGRNENTALLAGRQAGTGVLQQSPLARTTVRLDNSGGVFARQGTVIGSVFLDCNGNGIRDGIMPRDTYEPDAPAPAHADHEPGIPGVRIVTQEGLFVVTDSHGQYSLPGLRPVTHAFLVQPETLPRGTEVQITRSNDLRRGGSRVVPLRRGEMRAEHFAVRACTPAVLAEIDTRRARLREGATPMTMTASDLPIEGARAPARSSRSEAGLPTTTQLTPGMLAEAAASNDPAPADTSADSSARGGSAAPGGADPARRAPTPLAQKPAAQRQPLARMVRGLDPAPGFLDLADGDTVARRTQSIRIKGKADLTLALLLNGRRIGADRVGEHTTWERNNVQAMEFVAVRLAPGENRLTLLGNDGFGIERLRQEIRITAPGDPARLEIIAPETAPAAPASVLPVVVRILDARGLPVPASGTVTLRAGKALWDVTDIRPGTPGIQAYIDNGEATFGLIPPQVSGPDTLTVTGGFGQAETRITFTPDLDERVMIGVIEGAVALGDRRNRDVTGAGLLPADRFSGFEDTTTGLRGELYLKGAIRGDALLTLRYSSDRDTEDRLFRDIRGDEYYPVYGDNSERGYDAQSSGNLFVKVEKGRSYILYGDISIEPESSAFRLGGLRRVVTGAKGHWENDRVSVTVFGARTAQDRQIVEFAGRGVSGPYDLTLDGYVEGSEQVEILVRDEQGGDILSATPLRRGTDYLLDFFRDTITFDAPVRQFDGDGNPVSVRVTFEAEEDSADRYWLYGGEINYTLTDTTSVGVRAVQADAPLYNPARSRLQAAYIRHEDHTGGLWEAEVARSENAEGIAGSAARLSYERRTERESLSFEAVHSGRDFEAEGSLARAGTTQLRFSYGLALDDGGDLSLSAEYVKDRVARSERLTTELLYAHRFTERFRGEIGIEVESTRQERADPETSAALVLGSHWTPRTRPDSTIRTRLRLPIGGDPATRAPAELTLGLYREPEPGWRAYAEVEFTFGDEGVGNRSRVGFEYTLTDWLEGRTEFSRAPGALEETLHQGVAATYDYSELTTFRVDLEHSRLVDSGADQLTSLALGAKWGSFDDRWVGDADFDTTIEERGNTYYASVGLAGQVTPDLTVLGRTRIALDQRDTVDSRRMRSRIGAAYRPIANPRLEVLGWYEHRLEQKYARTETHMWSVDASYEMSEDLRMNGKYAGQHQRVELPAPEDREDGTDISATTQLLQAGLNWEFGEDRFQFGLNVARLWDSHGHASIGFGAEFGVTPTEGVLLAIGYNSLRGEVAGQADLYQEGVYLRFNLLLDNSLWDRLDKFLGQ